MIVRNAKEEDLDELVELAADMHVESDYSPVRFYPEIMRAFSQTFIENPDKYCLFMAIADNGETAGFFLGVRANYYFSIVEYAADAAFYVKPEYRGSKASVMLMAAFDEWAESKKVFRQHLSVTTGCGKADEFYSRLGYTSIGGQYRRDVE